MSILEDISLKIQNMLTTDARPDPPRKQNSNNGASNNTQELSSQQSNSKTDSNSLPIKWFPFFRGKESNSKSKSRDKKYRSTKRDKDSNKNVVNYNIINSNDVKIGANTTYICNFQQCTNKTYTDNNNVNKNNENNNEGNKNKEMPSNVKLLSVSTSEITLRDMFLIKTHLGYRWQDVFKSLNYSQGQIDQFEERYKSKGIGEIIYQLLIDWKQANGKDAHIGIIVNILWKQQQYECAERLSLLTSTE